MCSRSRSGPNKWQAEKKLTLWPNLEVLNMALWVNIPLQWMLKQHASEYWSRCNKPIWFVQSPSPGSQYLLNHTHPFCPKISGCAGDRISERWSKCTIYTSTSKCMIFARIHDAYIHVWGKPVQKWKKSRSVRTSTSVQQNVSMFCCWLRHDDGKHDRKNNPSG